MPRPVSFTAFSRFVAFTHAFQRIKRIILVTGEDRNENDMEHSYQLALVGWYLVDALGLKLDRDAVIKYALVHDLVEVYAGDVFFYQKKKASIVQKRRKEQAAIKRIKREFSEFGQLTDLIEAYEARISPEARFVYSLDKLLSVMNVYLDNGRSWQRDRVTLDMIRTKDEKVAVAPDLVDLWNTILKRLDVDNEGICIVKKRKHKRSKKR